MSPTRAMASWKGKSLWIFSLLLLFQLGACTQTATEDDDTTNTFVQIVSMTATDAQDQDADFLLSDVCLGSNEDPPLCSVANDNGVVTMRALPKDLNQLSSTVQDVVFYRYRVTYTRTDGLNVPGVDVPYPFDGVSNFLVPAFGEVSRAFIVVRHQAKAEAPLVDLGGGGGQDLISVIAQIDFYGRDGAGRETKVTGYLNITFADYGED